jgi:thioredoxin-related protein
VSNQRKFLLVALAALILVTAGVLRRVVSEAQTFAVASGYVDESGHTLKQISDSLVLAKKGHKQVILQFGSSGCTWCKLLHNVFESDKRIAEDLENNFVVVMVDVSDGNNKRVDAKYGHPTRDGLPVCVFLDSNGKRILC